MKYKKRYNYCPLCKQKTLTKEESMINQWGFANQKTACIKCRDKILTYLNDEYGWSIKYEELPLEYKFLTFDE